MHYRQISITYQLHTRDTKSDYPTRENAQKVLIQTCVETKIGDYVEFAISSSTVQGWSWARFRRGRNSMVVPLSLPLVLVCLVDVP